MKKAIALAVAMAAATSANAAFDANPNGFPLSESTTNLIFTAWTDTDGVDSSVNIDLGVNSLTGVGITDFSSIGDFSVDLSALGSDLSSVQWSVFAYDISAILPEVMTSANNLPVVPELAFSQQYVFFRNFMTANEGADSFRVGTEFTADFGANIISDTFSSVGVTGLIGDSLIFAGFDQQGTAPLSLASVSFDGATLSFAEVSEIPVPAAAWLFGSALLGLVGASRRKR